MEAKLDTKYNVKLEGLDCAHCAAKIESKINELEEIENASVDFINGKCSFMSSDNQEVMSKITKIVNDLEPDVKVSLEKTSSKKTKKLDTKYNLKLEGLDCAHCAAKIESKINELEEIENASVDFINGKCSFVSNDNEKEILSKVRKIVNDLEPDVKVISDKKVVHKDFKAEKIQLAIGITGIIIGVIVKGQSELVGNILFVASYLILGYKILINAFKNILRGNLFDENFLMALATIVALFLKEYLEAASVMVFYQFGELFQDQAIETSRKNITSLMDIRPDYANVIKDGEVTTVCPEIVQIDEVVIVRPGEKIPLDGVVIEGNSMLDTSSLTGESLGKDVEVGSDVVSGCINLNGVLKVQVKRLFEESTVNKILELVENNASKKANPEKFITKFARVYTPVVVISAAVLAALLPMFTNISYVESIKRASTFLIVSCPCALVISIPLGFYAGVGGLSKIGVLVKGSTVIESLSKVTQVVFDKTGTLTQGKFFVEDVVGEDTLMLASYAEYNSNHPIAKSIISAYGKKIDSSKIVDLKEFAGYGIYAKIENNEILVGNKKLMDKNNIEVPSVSDIGTIVYVSKDNKYEGYILIKDRIKEDSKTAVSNLKETNINDVIMLTGDNEAVANSVASTLGITKVYSNTLPDQKVNIVKSLLNEGNTVVVGDGINDAPVLTLADIGIAMGSLGSDAAIEAADVVIMDDMPSKVPTAINHSKKTMSIIFINITFAIGIKALVLILGAFGIANMWLAIFADVGVSVICILNSTRLLKVKRV